MQTVLDIAREIVAREGGFVDDPDDPGGPTNHGVTLATLQRLGRDINRDHKIDVADVQALGREAAAQIFVEYYFQKPGIGGLPAALQPSVFDAYVNMGGQAVKVLQRLLGSMRLPVSVDGVIGPQTTEATAKAFAAAPDHLVDAHGVARRNYYYALGDARPQSRKFVCRRDGGKGGWIARAEVFIAPRFHLTDEAHRARVAAWG
jgi:lysozyme family protein